MHPPNGPSADDQSASIWVSTLNESNDPIRHMMFGLWLSKSPEQRAGFVRACDEAPTLSRSLRRLLRVVKRLRYSSNVIAEFSVHEHPVPSLRWPVRVAIGSVVLALLAIGPVAFLSFRTGGEQRYTTAVGGYERAVLGDGSVAELNTATRMAVHIGQHEREITLSEGEVLFKVAHDRVRPFVVKAGNTRVRAVGTAFTVRVYGPNHVDVVVSEGVVTVNHEEAGSGILGLLPAHPAVGVQHTVSAGEIADDQMGRIVVNPVAADEIAARESWRDGTLIFGGKTLAEVVGEFNRYNTLHLVIADPGVATQKVGGMWRTTDVEVFVAAWTAQGYRAVRERGAGNDEEIVMLYGRALK